MFLAKSSEVKFGITKLITTSENWYSISRNKARLFQTELSHTTQGH